jgi:hypothetical protein
MKRAGLTSWALSAAACLAMSNYVAAAADDSPIAASPIYLRVPNQELVQFSGLLNDEYVGGTPANFLYPGGVVGLVVGVITQSAVESHKQNKQKQSMRELADRVLVPYQPTLSRFTYRELMQRALDGLPTAASKTLLKFQDPAGTGLTIECAPVFFMTRDTLSIVMENPILIHADTANAKAPPAFKNMVKIVAKPRRQRAEGEADSWITPDGAELEAVAIEELRDSLNLALTEAAQGFLNHSTEYRNVHYLEGSREKVEHAQVLADLPDHLILKTLRGWIMSVPVGAAIDAKLSAAAGQAAQ